MGNESFLPINLPSKCIPYDGIQPENITIRSYQGKDEIFLAEINPTNLSQKFLMVLKNVVRGIDPRRLTLGDRMYIMIWEYINSYSDTAKIKGVVCSHCWEDNEVTVNLLNLNKIELPDDFTQPYMIKLPVSGKEVGLRLYTIEDEIETEKFEKKNPEGYLYQLARSIVSEDPVLRRMEELSTLDTKDIAKIRAFHEKFHHGVDMRTIYTCPKCGEEDELEVPFRFDLIYPVGKTLTDTFGEGI